MLQVCFNVFQTDGCGKVEVSDLNLRGGKNGKIRSYENCSD